MKDTGVPRAKSYVAASETITLKEIRARCSVTEEGCWEWKGTIKHGYGFYHLARARYRVHRLSLVLTLGEPNDPEIECCHKCNNKRCCNPEHLYWGTRKQNHRQAMEDGLWRGRSGKITDEEVCQMRRLLKRYPVGFIAKWFGVPDDIVRKIRRRELYKSAEERVVA